MRKRELLIFVITVFLIYFLYQIIVSVIMLKTPVIQPKDLINDKHAAPSQLYDKSWKTVKKYYIDSSYNSQNWERWRKRYQGKLKTNEDARVAIESMLASLDDPYSRFLSQKEYLEQYNSIDAHITGIGVNIINRDGKILIHSVIEDAPAHKAGLKSMDIIMSVDGKNICGLDISDTAALIRGEENTSVTLKLKRGNKIFTKKIMRERIEIKPIEAFIKKNDIGYIKIKSFIGTNTPIEFVNALKTLNKSKGFIIDLRGNTGGLLNNAVVIANLFINNGTIVNIVFKNGYRQVINAQMNLPVINKPVVLLVDEASASASEILSGALKDNNKAVLVGTKTFGKGLVQQIVPLPNKTGLNITIAKYLTPKGSDINKRGIEPDIYVNQQDGKEDMQLEKAELLINELCSKNNN